MLFFGSDGENTVPRWMIPEEQVRRTDGDISTATSTKDNEEDESTVADDATPAAEIPADVEPLEDYLNGHLGDPANGDTTASTSDDRTVNTAA